MTAITLNLLAEEQLAQEARARDPIKLFIAVGLAALTLAVAGGGVLSAMLMQRRTELQGLDAQWKKMNAVGAGEGEFQAIGVAAEEIMNLNRSRVLMAPQLALVKDLIPPSVQLSQLGFALSVETTDAGGGSGEDGAESKHLSHARRIERLVVRLEGMASSSRPELEVDRFLKSLRSDPRFSALVEDIQLRSITRISKDNDKAGLMAPTGANFVIECWYKEKAAK